MHRVLRCVFVLAILAACAWAQDVQIHVAVGFNGAIPRRDLWPTTIRVTNGTADDLTLKFTLGGEESGYREYLAVERSLTISRGATKAFTLIGAGGDIYSRYLSVDAGRPLTFRVSGLELGGLRFEGVPRARIPFATPGVSSTREYTAVMLAIGDRAHQLATALPMLSGAKRGQALTIDDERGGVVAESPLEDLPDTALAYAGLTTILWTDPDPSRLAEPSQWRALLRFVENGGRLVLLGAAHRELFDQPAWSTILPATIQGVSEVAYAGAADRDLKGPFLDVRPKDDARGFGTDLVDRGANANDGRIERSLGAGKIVLALFDPFVLDIGDARLLARAIREASGAKITYATKDDETRRSRSWGIVADLGGKPFYELLLNQNIIRPNGGVLILVAFLFVLVIGPIDYMWLKHKKKLHWSPVTLLVYTIVFSVACVVATFFVFAPKSEVNRVAFIDCAIDHDGVDRGYGRVFHGIFEPLGGQPALGPVGDFDVFAQPVAPNVDAMNEHFVQKWEGAGKQTLAPELSFNAFREFETVLSGPIEGGFDATVETFPGDRRRVTIKNRFARPLTYVLVADEAGYFVAGDFPAGATVVRECTATDRVVVKTRPEDEEENFVWRRNSMTYGPPIFGIDGGKLFSTEYRRRDGLWDADRKALARIAAATRRSATNAYDNFDAIVVPSLAADEVIVAGVLDRLPFKDRSDGDRVGFSYAAVRRVVRMTQGR